jgi:hypothetical protein
MLLIPGALSPPPVVVLYLSPDQMLPITSILGGAIGFLILVWRRTFDFAKSQWSAFRGRGDREAVDPAGRKVR